MFKWYYLIRRHFCTGNNYCVWRSDWRPGTFEVVDQTTFDQLVRLLGTELMHIDDAKEPQLIEE